MVVVVCLHSYCFVVVASAGASAVVVAKHCGQKSFFSRPLYLELTSQHQTFFLCGDLKLFFSLISSSSNTFLLSPESFSASLSFDAYSIHRMGSCFKIIAVLKWYVKLFVYDVLVLLQPFRFPVFTYCVYLFAVVCITLITL